MEVNIKNIKKFTLSASDFYQMAKGIINCGEDYVDIIFNLGDDDFPCEVSFVSRRAVYGKPEETLKIFSFESTV